MGQRGSGPRRDRELRDRELWYPEHFQLFVVELPLSEVHSVCFTCCLIFACNPPLRYCRHLLDEFIRFLRFIRVGNSLENCPPTVNM